jgi:hypothetical protein
VSFNVAAFALVFLAGLLIIDHLAKYARAVTVVLTLVIVSLSLLFFGELAQIELAHASSSGQSAPVTFPTFPFNIQE